MNKPSEIQVREFWEWCGFEIKPLKGEEYLGDFYYHPDSNRIERDVDLDLKNLFRYAVPKVLELGYWVELQIDKEKSEVWLQEHLADLPEYHAVNSNPALALFWAIREVMNA